jgi:hypothetical protein
MGRSQSFEITSNHQPSVGIIPSLHDQQYILIRDSSAIINTKEFVQSDDFSKSIVLLPESAGCLTVRFVPSRIACDSVRMETGLFID